MTYAYRYPMDRKAHVRRVRSPWALDGWCWEAGRPGFVYLRGEGWHFDTWQDAMDHALSTWPSLAAGAS